MWPNNDFRPTPDLMRQALTLEFERQQGMVNGQPVPRKVRRGQGDVLVVVEYGALSIVVLELAEAPVLQLLTTPQPARAKDGPLGEAALRALLYRLEQVPLVKAVVRSVPLPAQPGGAGPVVPEQVPCILLTVEVPIRGLFVNLTEWHINTDTLFDAHYALLQAARTVQSTLGAWDRTVSVVGLDALIAEGSNGQGHDVAADGLG